MAKKDPEVTSTRRIEYLPLDEIRANPANPKGHDVDTINGSVSRFGYIDGVAVDERTGYLISGHGRTKTLRAMKARGDEPPDGIQVGPDGAWLVPVQVGWSSRNDTEAKAALISLNRTTELGGWVDESLLELLDTIDDYTGVGFTGGEVEDLRRKLEAMDDEPATGPGGGDGGGAAFVAKDLAGVRDLVTLHHGDCIEVLKTLPDASVDAVVTDPPYGLEFMGNDWDAPWKGTAASHAEARTRRADELNDPSKGKFIRAGVNAYEAGKPFQDWCELWAAECLRVLKPGGHMLAFGGSRTWHRLASAVEDAGFEIRDSIAWLYGSGFPKSLDVSKAIDKERDDRADTLRVTAEIARLRDIAGMTNRDLDDMFGFAGMAGHWTSNKSQPAVPTVEQWARLRESLSPDEWLDAAVWRLNGRKGTPGDAWQTADVVGERTTGIGTGRGVVSVIGDGDRAIRAANSDAARQWRGWGTALKPAHEPIVVGRKPLAGTVAANVLAHGTGALNIDGCRVDAADGPRVQGAQRVTGATEFGGVREGGKVYDTGRWPANVVLDETQAAELDRQVPAAGASGPASGPTLRGATEATVAFGSRLGLDGDPAFYDDEGGASRFFPTFRYEAKAPTSERPREDDVAHPTVKPVELMRWLVRLVTPPGGVVLEPFAGSGTTLEAAVMEGFACIGIEREASYLPLIRQRLGLSGDAEL
jgi:DNA modification methylase